ncbi:MAG: C39 family peptidase [Lachnospiraceae bacterium]|nr:C39 family peptidase [Lachnospiraceae bacterium]
MKDTIIRTYDGERKRAEMRAQYRRRRQRINCSFLIGGLLVLGLTLTVFKVQGIYAQSGKMGVMTGQIGGWEYGDCEAVIEAYNSVRHMSSIAVIKIEKPRRRTLAEALARLEELGEIDPVIAQIYANSASYPENMLTALANNPEMAYFVAGYMDKHKDGAGGLTYAEKEQEFPLFLQWDSRWGYEPYGRENNVGLAGCGPTCMSMVLYYLTGDETLTPDKIAAYSLENGYFVEGTGTAWALMEDIPPLYGIRVTEASASESAMKAELDRGHIMICAMAPGDFTAEGHFIVIYGYDQDGFMVNDPNCVARSGRRWTFDELRGQMKKIWSYGRTNVSSKGIYSIW